MPKAAEETCFTLSETSIGRHQIRVGWLTISLTYYKAAGPDETQSIALNHSCLQALKFIATIFIIFLINYYFQSQEEFPIIVLLPEYHKDCSSPVK